MIPVPPRAPLFPYTTLFRSRRGRAGRVTPDVSVGERRAHRYVRGRSEEHTSELQSHSDLVCRLLLEKKKNREKVPCAFAEVLEVAFQLIASEPNIGMTARKA